MKKNLKISLVLIFLMGLSGIVTAQTEMGSFLLSGSSRLKFTSFSLKAENDEYSEESGKLSAIEFTPGAGYFFANNLALGVQFSLNRESKKDEGFKYTETTSMLLPFARLYFGKSNVKPYVQVAAGPGWQKWDYDDDKETYNVIGYEFDGGLAVFLNQNISLDFTLGYGIATTKIDDWKSTAKGIGGNIGFSIVF